MARITFKSGDDYALRLMKTANRSEELMKRSIYAGAKVLADKIRDNLEAGLAGSKTSTGALAASLGITPITEDRSGYWNAKIGFDGYDGRGVPNQLKARVLESGSSQVKKRPFVAPALRASRKTALEAMAKVIDDEIKKNMKG